MPSQLSLRGRASFTLTWQSLVPDCHSPPAVIERSPYFGRRGNLRAQGVLGKLKREIATPSVEARNDKKEKTRNYRDRKGFAMTTRGTTDCFDFPGAYNDNY